MRIVHYTLGLYPNRTGGLNRYATDLMKEQAKEHQVFALIPGSWNPFSSICSISKGKSVDGVKCFYLNNALPQPLFYGIKSPCDFMGRKVQKSSFELFYEEVRPEVLHLHTLMGLPIQALEYFKEKGVKIVYTSHDYFGICPKVNFINLDGHLCEEPKAERCTICNNQAPSTFYLRMRSSRMAFIIRDSLIWLKHILKY